MNAVKSDSTNNQRAEMLAIVQNLIVKINNLVQHVEEPEYLVDLMPAELIQKYGREQLENTAGMLIGEGTSEGLSKKFSTLLQRFAEQYFGERVELFAPLTVRARYRIDRRAATNFCWRENNKMILELPVSSESVMVERLVEEMLHRSIEGIDRGTYTGFDPYMDESNRLYEKAAPMCVYPETRWLSAEEFIATYKVRPMAIHA